MMWLSMGIRALNCYGRAMVYCQALNSLLNLSTANFGLPKALEYASATNSSLVNLHWRKGKQACVLLLPVFLLYIFTQSWALVPSVGANLLIIQQIIYHHCLLDLCLLPAVYSKESTVWIKMGLIDKGASWRTQMESNSLQSTICR